MGRTVGDVRPGDCSRVVDATWYYGLRDWWGWWDWIETGDAAPRIANETMINAVEVVVPGDRSRVVDAEWAGYCKWVGYYIEAGESAPRIANETIRRAAGALVPSGDRSRVVYAFSRG